jgi:hypothetical protein
MAIAGDRPPAYLLVANPAADSVTCSTWKPANSWAAKWAGNLPDRDHAR